MARCEQSDVLIFAAAVADFAPERTAASKIKKRAATAALRLRRTPDIARSFGDRKRPDQVSVGFAADTEPAVKSAHLKLREKHFDFIFANPIRADDSVFGSDHNRGWLIGPTGRPRRLDRAPKAAIARQILLHSAEILQRKRGA
jgi:phosphopantothenoylcysteine decarboxylase/phosphopantothenate--cysteine ligase